MSEPSRRLVKWGSALDSLLMDRVAVPRLPGMQCARTRRFYFKNFRKISSQEKASFHQIMVVFGADVNVSYVTRIQEMITKFTAA